jgi:hypothetical protein
VGVWGGVASSWFLFDIISMMHGHMNIKFTINSLKQFKAHKQAGLQ